MLMLPESDDIAARLERWVGSEALRAAAALPIADCLAELLQWLRHGRSVSWQKNYASLGRELHASFDAVGTAMRSEFGEVMPRVRDQFTGLGERADRTRRLEVADEVDALLRRCVSPSLRRAAWRDLVEAERSFENPDRISDAAQQFRAAIRGAGHPLGWEGLPFRAVLGDEARAVKSVTDPDEIPDRSDLGQSAGLTPDERVELCGELAGRPTRTGRCVAWLAFKGTRMNPGLLSLGPITLIEARWAVPNLTTSTDFEFKAELAKALDSRSDQLKKDLVADDDRVALARVDLGERPVTRATADAESLVTALVEIAAFRGGGRGWELFGWNTLLVDGRPSSSSVFSTDPLPPGVFDLDRTADELTAQGVKIVGALGSQGLPLHLREALRCVQEAREADDRSRVLLHSRAVEMVAGHFELNAGDLSSRIARFWPESRFQSSLREAVSLALDLLERSHDGRDLARRVRTPGPGVATFEIHFDVIREELEFIRAKAKGSHSAHHVMHVLDRLADPSACLSELQRFQKEASILESRRTRVRNALTHGNPATDPAVESAAEFGRYISAAAVGNALDSFADGSSFSDDLDSYLDQAQDRTEYLKAGVEYLEATDRSSE